MQAPQIPHDETLRLRALRTAQLLDTEADERLDSITRLARKLLNVPIALVALVDADRQWFKSRQGLEVTETPRDISFCGHAILGDEMMVVEDSLQDPRFSDNPLVLRQPNIRLYAGFPLTSRSGYKLGTLCVIDSEPRSFSASEREILADLGRLAEQQLRSIALATTDELTQISNRRGLMLLARQMLARSHRNRSSLALALFDLDNFKRINDTLGHEEGDRALVEFARCMLHTFRDSDALGRLGGDEFCVLLPEAGEKAVGGALKRLTEQLAQVNHARPDSARISFSVGCTLYDGSIPPDLDGLIALADEQLYESKRARRDAQHSP